MVFRDPLPYQSDCGLGPGQLGRRHRALPDTPEGRLENLSETAKAHLRAKAEDPFRVIKHQLRFQKMHDRSIKKNDQELKMPFAFANHPYKIK